MKGKTNQNNKLILLGFPYMRYDISCESYGLTFDIYLTFK